MASNATISERLLAGAQGALGAPGGRRRYAALSLLGQLANAAALFVGAVAAARLFGPEGKGELTAWTLALVLGGLVLAGSVPTGLGRGVLAGSGPGQATAARHMLLAVLVVVPAATIAIVAGAEPLPVVCVGVIGIPAAVFINDLLAPMMAAKRAIALQSMRLIRPAIVSAGLLAALIAGASAGVDLAYLLIACGSVAAVIFAALAVRRGGPAGGEPAGLGEAARLGRGSFVTTVAEWLIRRIDGFVVVIVSGPFALGIYSVAVNWSEVTGYAGSAIGQAVFEDESSLDDRAARRLLRISTFLLGAISLAVLALGLLLLTAIFGDQFADARLPLALLAPGIIARGPWLASMQILLARGRGPELARLNVGVLIAGLPLWIGGTIAFGIEGAALASSIVYILQAALAARLLLGTPARAGAAS